MGFFTITLKNYRCFEDTLPVSIEIGKGFTALVGPNNSGKSSFLKFFLEYRSFFSMGVGHIVQLLRNKPHSFKPHGVEDAKEIPCNFNTRDGAIIFLFTSPETRLVKSNDSIANYRSVELAFFWQYDDPGHFTGAKIAINGVAYKENEETFDCSVHQLMHSGDRILFMEPIIQILHELKKSMYLGPFRNAINQGGANYFDMSIGDQFIKTWNDWKTGPQREQNQLTERVTEDIRSIFSFQRLEINAASNGKELHIIIDGYPHKLRELGAGLAQFILVFANAAIQKPSYILIDEPELNLHPSLQVDFLTSLAAYAKVGIVFCTHSIGLARAVADKIHSLQRSGKSIKCTRFEQTPNYAEFVGEMSFSGFKELGFERILLVEGQSEVRTIHQFLRMVKKDHQVVVIPLGGSQMIKDGVDQELAELKRITNKVSALIDSELSSADADLDPARKGFVDCCNRLGIDVHLTERRATENYFTDAAIKNTVGPACRELSPYEALKGISGQWSKSQNWRIARAMTLADIRSTDLGLFLSNL